MPCWPMRVLLDECLPKKLKRSLAGHEVKTEPECGWAGCKNGHLLGLAQEHFDVFLTVDRNLSFQQSLERYDIAVVVLVAASNAIEVLEPLMLSVIQILPSLRPGVIVQIGT